MSLLFALSPFLILVVGALALMLVDAFSKSSSGLGISSCVAFVASGLASLGVFAATDGAQVALRVAPYMVIDRYTLFFWLVICAGAALASLLASGYFAEHEADRGEFHMLMLFSTIGAMVLVAAGDMLTLVIGLETLSLGVYSMTAYRRTHAKSAEGGLKYFLLGSFAMAIALYGIALLYGATGTTVIAEIGHKFGEIANPEALVRSAPHQTTSMLFVVGMVAVIAGFAFKVSLVPFHAWTPDAYEGAPTPATAFLSVVVKVAVFGVFFRVLLTAFGHPILSSNLAGWPVLLAVLGLVTMTFANLVAARQDNIKRMLAYSSMAHAGYLALGASALLASPEVAPAIRTSLLFYLGQYAIAQVGAFGGLILLGSKGKEAVTLEDLSGVGRRHLGASLPLSVFLVTLAGIPPTVGFFAKVSLFSALVDAKYYVFLAIALLNTVLAAYYYLRVLISMYMHEPLADAPVAVPMRSSIVITALTVGVIVVLVLGIVPASSWNIATLAAVSVR